MDSALEREKQYQAQREMDAAEARQRIAEARVDELDRQLKQADEELSIAEKHARKEAAARAEFGKLSDAQKCALYVRNPDEYYRLRDKAREGGLTRGGEPAGRPNPSPTSRPPDTPTSRPADTPAAAPADTPAETVSDEELGKLYARGGRDRTKFFELLNQRRAAQGKTPIPKI